ncbi:MAG: hypothetical protein IKF91_03000 [Bacilli bacterium]|nr:hypothetical protein [Bacilli bacterium]
MSQDFFWNRFLYNDAIRILKKNNVNLNNMSKEDRQNLIEMVMEDLDDKYREN